MVWDKTQDWFWEGHIQERIVNYMQHEERYEIIKKSNTYSKQKGPDILARKNYVLKQVAVKGYPSDKYTQDCLGGKKGEEKRTDPKLQAKHWLAEAIFEVINAKSQNNKLELALGLPKFQIYISYIEKLEWFFRTMNLGVYLVDDKGRVELISARIDK